VDQDFVPIVEKMEDFLNSTFNVSKSGINSGFNAFYKEKENSFIKAVIDENNKGFLGSRAFVASAP